MKGAIKMQNVLRFDHQLTPCYNNELFGTDIMTGDQILHVLKLEKNSSQFFTLPVPEWTSRSAQGWNCVTITDLKKLLLI